MTLVWSEAGSESPEGWHPENGNGPVFGVGQPTYSPPDPAAGVPGQLEQTGASGAGGNPPTNPATWPAALAGIRAPVGRFVNWLSTVAGGYIYGSGSTPVGVPENPVTTTPIRPPSRIAGPRRIVHATTKAPVK